MVSELSQVEKKGGNRFGKTNGFGLCTEVRFPFDFSETGSNFLTPRFPENPSSLFYLSIDPANVHNVIFLIGKGRMGFSDLRTDLYSFRFRGRSYGVPVNGIGPRLPRGAIHASTLTL